MRFRARGLGSSSAALEAIGGWSKSSEARILELSQHQSLGIRLSPMKVIIHGQVSAMSQMPKTYVLFICVNAACCLEAERYDKWPLSAKDGSKHYCSSLGQCLWCLWEQALYWHATSLFGILSKVPGRSRFMAVPDGLLKTPFEVNQGVDISTTEGIVITRPIA